MKHNGCNFPRESLGGLTDKPYLGRKLLTQSVRINQVHKAHSERANLHMVNNQRCNVAKLSTLQPLFQPNAYYVERMLQTSLSVLHDMHDKVVVFFSCFIFTVSQ